MSNNNNNYTKNMLIGVFIIAACSLLVGIVMFLKPKVGDEKKTLYIRFANINKINIGTRVTYAGKPVGEVVAIEEIHEARKQPIDSLGRFYFYQLTLKVDSSVVVYNTDEISLQTSGLLGEKSVAIVPKRPPPGITPKLISNQPIYASSVDPIENAFIQLSDVANKMEDTLDEVTKWIKTNGDSVACAVQNFSNALHQADITLTKVNQTELIDEISTTASNLRATTTKIHDILCQMDQDGTFTNVSSMMKHLKKSSGSIELVTQELADGKGTLGKLLKFDDLYLNFNAVMSKIDTLMNDINHYGLLFHNNKSWQRTHTQRVNLMNALNTPQSFKNYFEVEVDQVNTSMERISMLIDKAETTPIKDQILQDEIFKKDFADLLRKADELAENLRLYNQQLMEAQRD
jgi:phospholipid/cholesterol/gamma-HCH transport system substrate-binding protein